MNLARIAPTVAPVPARSLLRSLRAAVTGRVTGNDSLATQVRALFPEARVGTFSSGRAALSQAIALALRTTGRKRVVLPAYTSYSVAAAAAASGALVDLCDLNPLTLQLDREALRRCVDDRTAAVVLGNLYGFPDITTDLDWLVREGIWLLDDAAQALGALEYGQPVGSRGHLGVLSFGRGKCVTLGDAGALLLNRTPAGVDATDSAARSGGRGWHPLLMASIASQ